MREEPRPESAGTEPSRQVRIAYAAGAVAFAIWFFLAAFAKGAIVVALLPLAAIVVVVFAFKIIGRALASLLGRQKDDAAPKK